MTGPKIEIIQQSPTLVFQFPGIAGSPGAGAPTGSNTQVQFNDGGAFGGHSGLTYDKATGLLSATKAKAGAYQLDSAAVIVDTSTARVLSAADNGKIIRFTNAAAITVTTASGLGAGFSCACRQAGTGQITIAAGAGTTRQGYGSQYKSAGQWALVGICAEVADEFIVFGETST